MRMKYIVPLVFLAFVGLWGSPFRSADTLPTRLSDEAYWKLITDLSEVPTSNYPFDVFTGNEPGYQEMLPELTKTVAAGGTYLGVGPEQNYTYIAAVRPKIAFLIDIRRDQMLEHLMYKVLFEKSSDRSDFVGRLFSRPRPASLTANSSVEEIFRAYGRVAYDTALFNVQNEDMLRSLKTTHKFTLTENDEKRLRFILLTFAQEGVSQFRSSQESPGYTRIMTSTDGSGRNWSFLASNENYDRVRDMFDRNLIVPLVGDFCGPKTVRMTGQYLRDHNAIVNAFYISNVEDYIQASWGSFLVNINSLPVDASSTFIRWTVGSRPPWLASMSDFLKMWSSRIPK